MLTSVLALFSVFLIVALAFASSAALRRANLSLRHESVTDEEDLPPRAPLLNSVSAWTTPEGDRLVLRLAREDGETFALELDARHAYDFSDKLMLGVSKIVPRAASRGDVVGQSAVLLHENDPVFSDGGIDVGKQQARRG